jgi:hypothetical protein
VCTYFSHVTIPRANKEFNWINNTVSRPVPPSIDSDWINNTVSRPVPPSIDSDQTSSSLSLRT